MLNLNGKWKLYPIKPEENIKAPEELCRFTYIDANVPGNVELDLINAKILPEDIYKGMNIIKAEKFEPYSWWYETKFETPKHKNDLIISFKGVDCYGEYWLNGKKFANSDNSLIGYEFNITDYLNPVGEINTLYVHIKSTVIELNKANHDLCEVPSRGHEGYTASRKNAHSFGWDIMPRAISAGIWQDVTIYEKKDVEFSQVNYNVLTLNKSLAEVQFSWEVDMAKKYVGKELFVNIEGKCKNSHFKEKKKIISKLSKLVANIENPYLWWPVGYGDANLYDVTMSVECEGELLCEKSFRMGVRQIKLLRTAQTDGVNGCFKFVINGKDIMCRGTNWVPMDVYHSRDNERYEKALNMAKDIGCNIIRCWGGNVYEQDYFYDFCDEAGIMIWQDFSMACAAYCQSEEFQKRIYEEGEYIVRKLRLHPSIILWSGDNECDQYYALSGISPDDNVLTRVVLKDAVRRNDSQRPYLPSSPYYDGTMEVFSVDKELSERHLWGARDYFKSDFYKQPKAHFISEIGYHGCPNRESLEKFINKDKLWPEILNDEWTLHSSDQNNNPSRIQLMKDQIVHFFGKEPEEFDDFIKASQYTQAEAKKFFIEHIRCKKPVKTGVIWWNLIDGWPQISDAVVDYYYSKKEAYDYIKRSQSPFIIIMDELYANYCDVIAVNDTLEAIKGSYEIFDIENDEILAKGDFLVEENGVETIDKVKLKYSDKKFLVIKWVIDNKTYYNHYLCGMPGFDYPLYKEWILKFKKLVD